MSNLYRAYLTEELRNDAAEAAIAAAEAAAEEEAAEAARREEIWRCIDDLLDAAAKAEAVGDLGWASECRKEARLWYYSL